MSDAEIVKEFLVESYENLDRLDQDLIALEKDPANRDTLAAIFRTIHTIKGTAGFLAFPRLEAVTHAGENLLARLRDGQLALTAEITTGLLSMVDAVRRMLASIESSGHEGDRNDNDQELIATLTALLERKSSAGVASPETQEQRRQEKRSQEKKGEEKKPDAVPDAAMPVPALGDILVNDGKAKPSEVAEALEQQNAGDPRHLGEILIEKGVVKPSDVVDALHVQQQARSQSAGDRTIRVDVGQLDRLMNRVGELVLLRNRILQHASSGENSELLRACRRLNLLTTELQEGVMKTRMQPIGNLWSRFPRIVRDMAVACGKRARIEMEGNETELDKTILEAIKDPLTHLVRNAVDHGIESPQARQNAGKNPEGLLFLRAFHEGGQVNIELTDDGAGLNFESIRNQARLRNLISSDQAARMAGREIAELIFLPGLSTAEKVSNVSGRGVGMDVVRTNIEKIGGAVDLQSKPGQGTTVRMKIPLTLAIVPALIVTSAGDRYAIPQSSLVELVRLAGERLRNGIERVNGRPVHRWRGRLLPLVCLNCALGIEHDACQTDVAQSMSRLHPSQDWPIDDAHSVDIAVLRADDRQFGLLVDEINDTEEIVVKPLSKQLKTISAYAGAAIMGDGKVALILDVLGLAQQANIVAQVRESALATDAALPTMAGQGKSSPVLLFQYGDNRRMAVDLPLVSRLEEFPSDAVERASGREVVQYRGQIMPLVRVSEVLKKKRHAPEPGIGSLQVIVHSEKGRSVGLVVDKIFDIVNAHFEIGGPLEVSKSFEARKPSEAETPFKIRSKTLPHAVLGSALIQKRVTDILDVSALIAAADWGCLSGPVPRAGAGRLTEESLA